ncbi:tetratricopeptide repeat protein [Clostridium malenominatum]|uniref:Tetratricopeptide repeat protein n=1 Tax=Clostridium malenominatum TaxID=1539 RepID=A0ABP3TV84_9CLOT
MDKSQKLYNKALEKYNKGYIEEALELSEKSISLNINNSAAINLKGLLYYILGDLEGSKNLWKMNVHINKDNVSKKYLQDTEKDERLLSIYNTAVILIKEIKINEALIMLKECSGSHFNYINVNNYLSICYIKKGDYIRALEHINNVLEVDRKNKVALQSKKELINMGALSKSKIKLMPIVLSISILISIMGITLIMKNIKREKMDNNTSSKPVNMKENEIKENKIEKDKVEVNKAEVKKNLEKFPQEELNNYIKTKDYIKIYEILKKWDKIELDIDGESIKAKAKEMLFSEGRETFYRIGSNYYWKMDYNEAKSYLLMAYEYGKDSWYYSYCIYTLGACYEQIGNIEEAIKYYKYYDEGFEKGEYKEIVLYNLSLLYKNIDKEKSKYYGNKLVKDYPNSIYNNTHVQNIINNYY